MSAIFALFNRSGAPVARPSLISMGEALADWGSASCDPWCDASAGLGALLRVDTPRDAFERQPLLGPPGSGLVLVADARIDNREELADALGISSHARQGQPDSALILAAWQRWGAASVERLQGVFAFVLWDGRRQTMHVVRDHVGLRPLFFINEAHRFAVATDVDALLALDGVDQELDEELLEAYWLGAHRPLLGRSMLRGIDKVLPAHRLEVHRGKLHLKRWWTPGAARDLKLKSVDQYAAQLSEHLEVAVGCRLPTPRLVASHLSGGLDSAFVTVVAAQQLRRRGSRLAKAYSWFPPVDGAADPHAQARTLIDAVCDQEGIACAHTELSVDDLVAYLSGDISVEPNDWQQYERLVCRAAESEGVGVILSGFGGDEVISHGSAGRFAELLARGHLLSLAREGARYLQDHAPGLSRRRRIRLVLTLLHRSTIPMLSDPVYSWLRHALGRDRIVQRLVEAFARRHGGSKPPWESLARQGGTRLRERRTVRESQVAHLDNGHLTLRLESWAHLAARHNLTYRYPLLDRRVLDFGLSLPGGMYLNKGQPRFLFRQVASQVLPHAVSRAQKLDEKANQRLFLQLMDSAIRRIADAGSSDGTSLAARRSTEFLVLWNAVSQGLDADVE